MQSSPGKFLSGLLAVFLFVTLSCGVIPGTPTANPAEETFRYDPLPDAGVNEATFSNYRAISQWGKFELSYYFINGTEKISGDSELDVVRSAFQMWAEQTPLRFSEASDPDQADILVGWARGDHGDGDPFDGPGDILAHASYPNPYEDREVILHFDDDERWVNSEAQNVDLLTVAAHEIGHNLGLDHSRDPDALMYPAYSGPHRFLSEDDIAGVQSLYGIAAEPADSPEVPPADATPPPAVGQDSDQDGLTDDDEVLKTGTDPQNPDSDGDSLSDGVEVQYGMNPLDADMDKDGVDDGTEVSQGSDPTFPDQDQTEDIPDDLSDQISEFLTEAIELQIEAYQQGDPSVAADYLAGDVYAQLEDEIASLNSQGLVQISEIDYYQSYINDIRMVSNTRIEVDTCEVWTTSTFRASDGELIQSQGPELLPQTITLEDLGGDDWYITQVEFFQAPAFCQG